MKTDKDLSTVNIQNKESKATIMFSLLPILSLFLVVVIGLLNNTETIEILKISILTFLLTTIIVFFIRMQVNILIIRFAKLIIQVSYLISILLIMIPLTPDVYSFWMIGGLLIAMLIDSKLGLLVYFNMTFILSLTYSLRLGSIIHFLVMGILFALLAKHLKEKSTVISASIILLSTDITLSFLMNNFLFESDRSVNYMASFFSILAVIVTAFFLSYLYERLINKPINNGTVSERVNNTDDSLLSKLDDNNEFQTKLDDSNELTTKAYDNNELITRTSYDVLLSDNNELLIKMKEFSESLYNHCKLIGDLSGRAAQAIGANEELARAGGYYHEVGKINGKNYIEEGLKFAQQYSFPGELREILKQHNIKHDKPTFVESAIVMISDNVVSTIEYIEKTGEQKYSSDKIIDNIFKMRMDKGTFDDAVISIKDFKLLREFYKKEFKSKDNGIMKEESI